MRRRLKHCPAEPGSQLWWERRAIAARFLPSARELHAAFVRLRDEAEARAKADAETEGVQS